mmetsp:Transcript_24661/g.77481  ORF Transcript_24661/g.77481 Transcript_24661/m.77481 type:complete len:201 (-) Transcript_24661:1205-1807(-)
MAAAIAARAEAKAAAIATRAAVAEAVAEATAVAVAARAREAALASMTAGNHRIPTETRPPPPAHTLSARRAAESLPSPPAATRSALHTRIPPRGCSTPRRCTRRSRSAIPPEPQVEDEAPAQSAVAAAGAARAAREERWRRSPPRTRVGRRRRAASQSQRHSRQSPNSGEQNGLCRTASRSWWRPEAEGAATSRRRPQRR